MIKAIVRWIRLFFAEAWLSYHGRFAITSPFNYIAGKLGWPFFLMLFFVFMGKFVGFADPVYIVIGHMLLIPATSGMGGVTRAIGEEREFGTLSYVLGSPGQRAPIFLGRSFFYIVDGFVTSFIGVALSALIFGISLANINLWLLLSCAVLISITACGLGFFFGSLSLLTRDAWTILNTFWEALYILIGVNFPVSSLPAFLQPLSYALPMTRGIMAARLVMNGGGWSDISTLITGEALLGGIYILIGYGFFLMIEKRSMASGTLDAV